MLYEQLYHFVHIMQYLLYCFSNGCKHYTYLLCTVIQSLNENTTLKTSRFVRVKSCVVAPEYLYCQETSQQCFLVCIRHFLCFKNIILQFRTLSQNGGPKIITWYSSPPGINHSIIPSTKNTQYRINTKVSLVVSWLLVIHTIPWLDI